MYGVFTTIDLHNWVILWVSVGQYTMHGLCDRLYIFNPKLTIAKATTNPRAQDSENQIPQGSRYNGHSLLSSRADDAWAAALMLNPWWPTKQQCSQICSNTFCWRETRYPQNRWFVARNVYIYIDIQWWWCCWWCCCWWWWWWWWWHIITNIILISVSYYCHFTIIIIILIIHKCTNHLCSKHKETANPSKRCNLNVAEAQELFATSCCSRSTEKQGNAVL